MLWQTACLSAGDDICFTVYWLTWESERSTVRWRFSRVLSWTSHQSCSTESVSGILRSNLCSVYCHYKHIMPTLRDTLHWLPVPQRITFKIALTVFDCARGRCPAYFSDICVPVHSVAGRSRLRSADHGDLIVPRVQTQRYGSRNFRVSGPTVWNSLPQNLRSSDISREQFKHIKTKLKTWLFEHAYV